MNREIEFRGIKNHSNEWVYGNLIQDVRNEKYIIPFNVIEQDWHYLVINRDIHVFIKQETVGQYVGETDINGKKIFEHDICIMKNVVGSSFSDLIDVIGTVGYKRGGFYFVNKDGLCESVGDKPHSWEIIGNSHKNKEKQN